MYCIQQNPSWRAYILLAWQNIFAFVKPQISLWRSHQTIPWATLILVTYSYNRKLHLYLIQINHQPEATVFQFIILTFVYSSTCFGRFPAHHQELNDCSRSLWFYLFIVVRAVLCSWSGRPRPRYEGKTRGCHCSHWAPDDGRENVRNMLSCKQTSG
jgi:hypothetical protein